MILEFIFLFILLLVVVSAATRHIRQTQARAGADRIINGEGPATEEHINKIITRLLCTKNWTQGMTEQDRVLVERLRDMRKEMRTPHR